MVTEPGDGWPYCPTCGLATLPDSRGWQQPRRLERTMSKHKSPLTKPVAARARAVANSVTSNEQRRVRGPTVIDWDGAIASLLDIFDGVYPEILDGTYESDGLRTEKGG
jgi:hypothetical protein